MANSKLSIGDWQSAISSFIELVSRNINQLSFRLPPSSSLLKRDEILVVEMKNKKKQNGAQS